MKQLILILCISMIFMIYLPAQNCKVLLEEINDSYSGDCKKGKANGTGIAKGTDSYSGEFKKGYPEGQGVYTWSNGNTFEGFFKKGKKEGQGKMTYRTATQKDSVVVGFWKNDQYAGLYENPYKTHDKSPNITGFRFTKNEGSKKVRVYIREDNVAVFNPNMNVVVHHGLFQDLQNQRDFLEITNVTFPIKLRGTYKREFFEIEILEPGSWDVRISIENINGLKN